MGRTDSSAPIAAWLIAIGVIAGLVLLSFTLRLIILSDPSAETEVAAYLTGGESIVILHEKPDNTSGVATLMERGTRVTVELYDSDRNPSWAYVRRGVEGGWVQLEYLRERPP